MINLDAIKITPRDDEVLRLLAQGMQQQGNCRTSQHQSAHGETTLTHSVLARRNY